VGLNLGGKTKVKPGQGGAPRSFRGTAQSGGPQDRLIDAATGTTCGQLAVDDHRRNRTDAKPLGALGHLGISHVVNGHVTRGAGSAPDDLDCFLAGRASGTEYFDLSLGRHVLGPTYLGSAARER